MLFSIVFRLASPSSQELGYVTSEKITPSPISLVADIQQAINIEKRMGKTKSALKDSLSRICADYNKMVTVKRHRLDGQRRQLIYNMLLESRLRIVY